MRPGMHDRLLELLADALAGHGYTTTRQAALEGRSGTVYTVPLLAEGPAGAVIIDLQADDPLPAAAVGDMADVLHDVGADAALLCHLGAVETGAHADGVSLWGFDHLVHFVGEALVCQATGATPQPITFSPVPPPSEPLAESLEQLLPAAFQTQETGGLGAPVAGAWAADDASQEPGLPIAFDLDALEQMPGLDGAEQASPPALEPAAGPEPAPRYAHPLLPIRITPDEARVRVRALLTPDNIQMVLQPVHLIDYECDLLAEGSLRYDTVTGRVQVHGTDKTVAEVDGLAVDPQGFTRLPDVPRLPSHERTLRASPERAAERAASHLLDSHTRVVEVEVDDPDLGFSYTEKKKVAPRPDHIRLNPIGVFHRVLWRLVGPAGHVDIDALTGDVVDEVLHNPRHDTLVID